MQERLPDGSTNEIGSSSARPRPRHGRPLYCCDRWPTCSGRAATIIGTDGADEIEGTQGSDVIVGLGDDDYIHDGDDVICGGVALTAEQLGINRDTLRTWVRQAEVDGGVRPGLTSDQLEELSTRS